MSLECLPHTRCLLHRLAFPHSFFSCQGTSSAESFFIKHEPEVRLEWQSEQSNAPCFQAILLLQAFHILVASFMENHILVASFMENQHTNIFQHIC